MTTEAVRHDRSGTVGGVERALRADLGDAVRVELAGAGLPVGDEPDAVVAGAEVEVDLGDDASGGVFVTWRVRAMDVEAANRSLIDGGFDDTAARRTDFVAATMRDAMIAVLVAAGFEAMASDDDMRPLALRVRGTAPTPAPSNDDTRPLRLPTLPARPSRPAAAPGDDAPSPVDGGVPGRGVDGSGARSGSASGGAGAPAGAGVTASGVTTG